MRSRRLGVFTSQERPPLSASPSAFTEVTYTFWRAPVGEALMLRIVKSLRDGKTQVSALPLRLTKARQIEVLLITSRETQRWVIPKGWPVDGVNDWDAAAKEAREEAGLLGDVGVSPLGSFAYFKRGDSAFRLLDVAVYPLWVRERLTDWREKGQRDELWVEPAAAALLVHEPGLKVILQKLSSAPLVRKLAS